MKTILRDKLTIHLQIQNAQYLNEQHLIDTCVEELHDLSRWLDWEKSKRIIVYVLASYITIREITNGFDGYAFPELSIIILSYDRVGHFVTTDGRDTFRRILRHELTHVLAFKKGSMCPELKSEGLATFFQELGFGIHSIEGLQILRPVNPAPIHELLSRSFFLSPQRIAGNYWAAGSFTAFLIRKFGWPKYWQFYYQANRANYQRRFYIVFGHELKTVETDWIKSIPPYQK